MNKRAGYTYDVHENCLIFKTPQPQPPRTLSIYAQNFPTPLILDIQF